MNVKWFEGLDKTDQKNFTELLKTYVNDPVLRQLKVVLTQRLKELKNTQTQDYDKPSWSHYQAHKNGQIQDVEFVLSLLGDIK
jgi:hypothetical protein